MAAVDIEWLNTDDDQWLAASTDKHSCQSAVWKDIVKHVEAHSRVFLSDQPKTVASQLQVLL
jgi:hypothetical protein